MALALPLSERSSRSRQRVAAALIVVAVISSLVLFWRLGEKPLENWDEGIHANVTLEMYRQGAWLDLSYRDELYTAKPPLSFWLRAGLFPVLGETELAIRWWSAVAGVATAVLLSYWAWQLFANARMAALAGLVFVTGRYVMFHSFRTGETDGLFILLLVAALYAYWRSLQSPGWFVWFGVLTDLAVMTKSLAGAIPAIIVAIDLTLGRRWRQLGWRKIGWSVLAAVVVVLPWHAVELVRHGREFWQSYFGFHVLERAGEVLYANQVPWYWYADIVGRRMFPYVALVPLAALLALRRAIRDRDELDRLLLVWSAVVFVMFSLIQTKFDWYILPIYPALVLLVSRAVWELVKQPGRLVVGGFLVSLAVMVFVLPRGLAHEGLLWFLTPYAYLPEAALTSGGRVVVGLGVAGLVWLTAVWLRRRLARPEKLLAMLAAVAVVVLSLGWQASYLRHLPTAGPFKNMAQQLDDLNATEVEVVDIKLLTSPAGYFYLRRVPGLMVREVAVEAARGPYILTTATERDRFPSSRAILERDRYVLLEWRPAGA
ncbi:MAG: glycosyltransferase family 39 protein [Candidatus Kerfeldbacteria bacterium]|nr:glycosyltransferase family 39 protein [Candidatus Kerfeldbacteria bacterium]